MCVCVSLTAWIDPCPSAAPTSAPVCWANCRRSFTSYSRTPTPTWERARLARNAACCYCPRATAMQATGTRSIESEPPPSQWMPPPNEPLPRPILTWDCWCMWILLAWLDWLRRDLDYSIPAFIFLCFDRELDLSSRQSLIILNYKVKTKFLFSSSRGVWYCIHLYRKNNTHKQQGYRHS